MKVSSECTAIIDGKTENKVTKYGYKQRMDYMAVVAKQLLILFAILLSVYLG